MTNAYVNEQIKSAISVKEAAEHYGLKAGRNDVVCCPFHNDRGPSLKLNEKYFFCFGCGAKGDIFDFVMKLFNIPFDKAVERLCEDFSLPYGNCTELTQSERNELLRRSQEVIERQKQKEAYRKQLLDEYFGLWDAFVALEYNTIKYAPRRGDTELHPLYKVAIDNLEAVRYELKNKEEELKNCG